MESRKKTLFEIKQELENRFCIDEKGDILIMELNKFPGQTVRLIDFYAFAFCKEGHLSMTIDDTPYEVGERTLLFVGQYSFVDHIVTSPDFSGLLICFSQSIITQYFLRNKDMWSRLRFLQKNRIITFSDENYELNRNFYNIFTWLLNQDERHIYYKHIIDGIFRCFLYCQLSKIPSVKQIEYGIIKDRESLITRFVDMVKEDEARHRDIAYYADLLCVTPKYLSTICRREFGKTAHQIIEEEAVTMIRHYLFNTDLSVKQISVELNFCSLSFFGKFVRQHFGKSPTQLREEAQK